MKRAFFLACLSFQAIACFSQSSQTIQFIENKHQWPERFAFGARVQGGMMFTQSGQFNYYFLDKQKLESLHDASHLIAGSQPEGGRETVDGSFISASFLGANWSSEPVPFDKQSVYYNYFIGADTCDWASNVPAYGGVNYHSFYDGIDMKLYSSGDAVKYDFIVSPGADPSDIRIRYAGMDNLTLSDGEIHVQTRIVRIAEGKPEAYQFINNKKESVRCEYQILNGIISFIFPDGYDLCEELVIDPLLIFSTYSGSTADNWGSTATFGENGNLYSAGVTNHNLGGNFPATAGAFQTSYGGMYDIGLLKYDSTGSHLLYASYLGGSDSESAHSLVMNANKEILILGTTGSANFPTTAGAFDRIYNQGTPEQNVVTYFNGTDIFVARVSSNGSQLLSSTYLGGSANDGLNPSSSILSANYGDQLRGDILTDSQGNVYVSTVTSSANFPVANSFSMTYKGGATDALLLKLNPTLSQVVWGAFIGGNNSDASHTIKLDNAGNIFLGGGTASSNFPATSGTYQTTLAGSADGWIAHVSNDGSTLLAATLTGTASFNQVYFLDLNANDEVYVYGQTVGSFPISQGVYANANSGQFLQKFSTDLKSLKFSTVFGSGRGIPDISPTAFLVNDCNNIYMSGWGGKTNTLTGHWPGSSTVGMPTTPDGYQKTTSGSDFYFVVMTDDASQLLYGTFLGGTQSKTHVDGGTSRFDKGGIVYHAVCSGCQFDNPGGSTSDFPTTTTAWSRTNRSQNCNNAAFKFDLSSLKARIQTNSVTLKNPGLNRVCLPDKIVFQNRSTGGQFYEWKFGDGTTLVKPDTSAIVYQYHLPGQYVVKLKAVDAGTCIGKDSTSTIVNVYKALGLAGPDQTICGGSSTLLSAAGGVSYVWSTNSRSFESTAPSPSISPEDSTKYFVTITDINGCVRKDTVVVNVIPGMDLKFDVTKLGECLSRPKVKVVNRTDTVNHVYFDFGDGTTSTDPTDVHDYKADGNYNVKLVGKREFCIFEKSVTLPFFNIFVPNVITPGGSSGFNDCFRIKYGDHYISEVGINVSLIVYNRWGEKVYQNDHYKDDWSAEGLAPGVYYYEAEIEGETTCKNWVQVIK